ncbi:MAG: ABC transporter permease [Bacteroidota bacterium]|nr:ABC transporter permease [Bacteroidota bacterium]
MKRDVLQGTKRARHGGNTHAEDSTAWDLVIRPRRKWFHLDLKELWRYRDLVFLFVRRDFVAQYKQTILGPLWFIIQPLLTTVMFTIVFGRIAKISTDGLPMVLFYMAGTICWTYFAECLNKTSMTFISHAGIFGKVYFPRLTVPVSIVLSNLIAFGLQFAFFLGFIGYYTAAGARVSMNAAVLLTPVLLLLMAALGLGLGIMVSAMTTRYRDLRFLVSFGVQLAMYATPVAYPLSVIPEKWKAVAVLNPMAPIIEAFRYGFLGAGAFRTDYLLLSAGMTMGILLLGIMLFSRVESTFMDTV